jgi:hypothetical protein
VFEHDTLHSEISDGKQSCAWFRQTNSQTVAIPSSSESKEMRELLFIGAECNHENPMFSLAVTDSLPVSMESVEREVQRREFDSLYAAAFNG